MVAGTTPPLDEKGDRMKPRQAGRVFLALLAVGALSVPTNPTAAPAARASDVAPEALATAASVDTAGIPLVVTIEQPRFTTEDQAQQISDALVFAESHPDDVGYPWLGEASGSLELSAASERGRDLLDHQRSAFTTATRIRDVEFSYGKLLAIADDVTTLQENGFPDAALIYATAPDYKGNRVVIRVSGTSQRLFKGLADRYGTKAIAVLIDPDSVGGGVASRLHDSPPYWGGARIGAPGGGCTDSFSWWSGSWYAMLTAAHCAPAGGNVTIGGTTIGSVKSANEENWNTTYGTRYYTNQGVYRGDVALIRLKSSLSSSANIFRGGDWRNPDSTSYSRVAAYRQRYSQTGEDVLVGGATTGETGLYHIAEVGGNWWYSNNGPNVWVRNIVRAYRLSPPCAYYGDSGGSVFGTVSGGVIAIGTFSGFYGTVEPPPDGACGIVFTDIYNSFLGLPGNPLTR